MTLVDAAISGVIFLDQKGLSFNYNKGFGKCLSASAYQRLQKGFN